MSKKNTEIKEKTITTVVEPTVTPTEEPTSDEKSKDVVKPVATEEKPKTKEKYNKNIDYVGRGFSSFEEAISFIETEYFKGLGNEDKEEYLNWLQK